MGADLSLRSIGRPDRRLAPIARLATALPVLLVATLVGCGPEEELPRFAPAPDFVLTDQNEQSFGPNDLLGKVWVANFIFTSCPSMCPILTATMAGMQKDLADRRDAVHFVSVTVDPKIDTPPVLKSYAESHGADPRNWSFLTGPAQVTEDVVVKGFKQAQEEVPARDGEPRDIRHGSHFVLVDRVGVIRGFYPSRGEGPVTLVRDAERLIAAGSVAG